MSDLTVDSTARDQAAAVRSGEISAAELLELHLDRIEERNPELNAIVSLDAERARAAAAVADQAQASGEEVGPLHGLPFAVKDTHALDGWRTTYGSPIFADAVADHDDLLVERIRASRRGLHRQDQRAGVRRRVAHVQHGLRRDPQPRRPDAGPPVAPAGERRARWPPGWCRSPTAPTWAARCATRRRSAASSGMRPSLGRVPEWPLYNQWESTSVGGPMARNVGDLALLLSVIAGPDPRAPQALGDPGATFAPPLTPAPLAGLRVATSVDLGGAFAVDHEVADVVRATAARLSDAGASVVETHPDLSLADDTFRTLRAWHFQAKLGRLLAEHPTSFKPSLEANIRAGEPLTGADVARGYAQRTALAETMRLFFGDHDVLLLPTSQVPPFPVEQEFPETINGAGDAGLPGLDALGVLHHRHRLPGDLRPGRAYVGRVARRRPAGRPPRRRPAAPRGRRGRRGPPRLLTPR